MEAAYLAALSRPYLATPYARLREALRDLARLHPRDPADRRAAAEDPRILREQAARWAAPPPPAARLPPPEPFHPMHQWERPGPPPPPEPLRRPLPPWNPAPAPPPPPPAARPGPSLSYYREDEADYDFGQFGQR